MKIGGKRNFGYGRTLGYAIHRALIDKYRGQKIGTHKSHEARMKPFAKYLRNTGIRDLTTVTCDDVVGYAEMLGDMVTNELLAVSTAQNRLSSINGLMRFLRNDNTLAISPSRYVGRRSSIATMPPAAVDLDRFRTAVLALYSDNEYRVAQMVQSCRYLAARAKEACLLELRVALRSAEKQGVVAITKGSKGGLAKKQPRVMVVPTEFVEALRLSVAEVPEPNIIPAGMKFVDWYQEAYRRWRPYATRFGLKTGFHDLRRGKACELYEEITGFEATCIAGRRLADRDSDIAARAEIAEQLGHGRIQIVGAYIGARR